MIRIELSKEEFEKLKWKQTPVIQEVVKTKYFATFLKEGCKEKIEIEGEFTVTGDTPDFYELSNFWWNTTNNLEGEWSETYDVDEFINGEYSIKDYVEDEIIDKIISEEQNEISHRYFITNLPPSCEISMSRPVNMKIEKEYNGVNEEITPEILQALDWRKWYVPDPNGLGTEDQLKLIGQILSKGMN